MTLAVYDIVYALSHFGYVYRERFAVGLRISLRIGFCSQDQGYKGVVEEYGVEFIDECGV